MKGQKSCFTTSIKEKIHLKEDEKRRIKQEPSLIRYAHLCVQIYIDCEVTKGINILDDDLK